LLGGEVGATIGRPARRLPGLALIACLRGGACPGASDGASEEYQRSWEPVRSD
jgi:hypothetical protein